MATLEKSELDIALERLTPQWLAGFFDGEGCITCVRQHYNMPAVVVTLTQCDLNILTLVSLKFADGREPYCKPRKKTQHSDSYMLQFGGKSCLAFLEVIQPYAILKRKLVDWGVEMAKLHLKAGGNRRWNKGKMDPSVRARREELFHRIRGENNSNHALTLQKDKLQ